MIDLIAYWSFLLTLVVGELNRPSVESEVIPWRFQYLRVPP